MPRPLKDEGFNLITSVLLNDTSLQTNMSTSTSNTHLHLKYMNKSALQ